jgi:hypothetical protein
MNTSRFGLPLLSVAQAHKELTHNEALFLLDAVVQPVVESQTANVPSNLDVDDSGKCWLVAAGASGAWDGRADHLACWTGDDWRFVAPFAGMSVGVQATASRSNYINNQWNSAPIMVAPVGGAIIDGEARAALAALLAHLRQIGILST